MRENKRCRKAAAIVSLGFAASCLLHTACTTTPPQEPVQDIVYPPPPAEPRYRFERSLRFSSNVQIPTAADKLKKFATGDSTEFQGLVKPFDVAVWQGRVYVTDSVQNRVVVFDIPGGRYFEFGLDEPGALSKPLGIDAGPSGEIYVIDASAKRIQIYDADGQFLRSITKTGLFRRPSDVAVDTVRDRIYVVDTGGVESDQHGVHVFALSTGEHLRTLGSRGEQDEQFNLPLQIAVGPDGAVHVVDGGNFRVVTYDAEGRFRSKLGKLGRYPGQFARPKGIAVDNEGRLYVVDTAFGNFQIFSAVGELLLFVGQRGQSSNPGNYMLPSGIDVDDQGKVYIVDQFFRKVDVYTPVVQP